MWTQVVGKVCLALTPPVNHFWNIAFRLTPRGLATPPLLAGARTLSFSFDFVEHQLELQRSDGDGERLPLEPMTVAAFHRRVMEMLERAGVPVRVWTMPVEVPAPIRFEEDTVHGSYDPAAAGTFQRVLRAMAPAFEAFRGRFVGKCSPVHFFWGSFDLAVTRFSGRRAPVRPGADSITREAYSHEVISHGFWPGSGAVPEPAFYAYAAPWPPGLEGASLAPAGAFYSKELAEFILPYDVIRSSPDPSEPLLEFLASTYDAAADLAGWPRAELERT
jgi:hypothetical protein